MDVTQLSFSDKQYYARRYFDERIEELKKQGESSEIIKKFENMRYTAMCKLEEQKEEKLYFQMLDQHIIDQLKKEGKFNMELQTFNNDQFGVLRTAEIEGKIHYCGIDVAKALGYSKPQNAINMHCPHALKQGVGVQTGFKADGTPAIQNIEMSFIPEGDVYRLIARSKLPQAEKFESWVFDEVLPQIAHTGSYNMPQRPEDIIKILLQASDNNHEEIKGIKQELENHELNHELTRAEYDHLSSKVSNRLKQVKEVREWNLNPAQYGALKHGINGDICRYMGVRTRTMIARKDFEKACLFVEGWDPSSVTLKEIEEHNNA